MDNLTKFKPLLQGISSFGGSDTTFSPTIDCGIDVLTDCAFDSSRPRGVLEKLTNRFIKGFPNPQVNSESC